jgi:hypothetical protein
VWATLAVVVLLRTFVLPPDPEFGLFPNPSKFSLREEPRQRFRRPPTVIPTPTAKLPNDLPRLEIEISPYDARTLRGYHWDGWRGRSQERPEVAATVSAGGVVYENVALHLKGAAGSFRPFDDKPALTLNFSKFNRRQRFHGYSKLSLNNSVQDPSYLCEALTRELFLAAGVPAPQAGFATVTINGVEKGLYVMVEGYNKDFLRRHFSDVRGNLYDGGFCQDINPNLAVNSGDYPHDRSDLERLMAAAAQPQPAQRWEELNQVLDVERFFSLLAMEVLLCHWDGYAINRNNYRVFHDLEAGRMVFMPHGLDQMFDWPPGRFPPEGPIRPPMNGFVAQAVMSTPEGIAGYMERLGTLATNVFSEQAITNRVRELAQRVQPTLAAYGPDMAERHRWAVDSLCERISGRFQSVAEQLRTPRGPLPFDADGRASLSRWKPRITSGSLALTLDHVEVDGQPALRIAFGTSGGTASWRTRVLLEQGHYRFEGRGKVGGAEGDGRIAFRISGARIPPQVVRATEWTAASFSFEVPAPVTEVELVCEFSGRRGEAWFDLDSLCLIRETRSTL